jgi:hypothetical protein
LAPTFSDGENDSVLRQKEKMTWIPPAAVWSQLKFPVKPENGLETKNTKPTPEIFDAQKLNASISSDGYVIGQKFCRKSYRTHK